MRTVAARSAGRPLVIVRSGARPPADAPITMSRVGAADGEVSGIKLLIRLYPSVAARRAARADSARSFATPGREHVFRRCTLCSVTDLDARPAAPFRAPAD